MTESKITRLKQYKMLLDYSSIVSKTNIDGVITYVNDNFCQISGYTENELIGKNHNIIKCIENTSNIYRDIWHTIKNKHIWQGTIKNRKKNGELYYVKSTIAPILDENSEILEYMAVRTDVTDLINKDKIIATQFKDELTCLQNRTALLHELTVNANNKLTLILINIDRFSNINDYFGYEAGDELLKKIAKEISNKYEKAYRISGDEFAVICNHALRPDTKDEIVNFVNELENSNYYVDNLKISLFLSCGAAYGLKKELYRLSHRALKYNKNTNNKVTFFNENANLVNKIKENIEIISDIKNGIDNDMFIPFYQAIVDNKTKKIVKYESLIRLKTQNGKVLSPFFFLDHAKKAKLYTKLTKIMINKTFKKFANLDYEFSINLTLEDIESKMVVELLKEYLEQYKCGDRVVIEIVESEGINDFEVMSNFIKTIKNYGCKIAIDDFGTGYSNFSYLSRLDIDFIKIDGSLVSDIDKDESKLVTIESILYYAKKMGIKTIAEFVENESIYNILKDIGVDFSQGYYFSKPAEALMARTELNHL